jgi:hypothetical protein
VDTQLAQQFAADCLQRPDVLANSQAQLLQVQDWVADQLPRVVSRRAAASAYLHDVNMIRRQIFAAGTQSVETLPGAQSYNRGVLNHQHGVWYLLSLPLSTQPVLQLQNFPVIGEPAVMDLEGVFIDLLSRLIFQTTRQN